LYHLRHEVAHYVPLLASRSDLPEDRHAGPRHRQASHRNVEPEVRLLAKADYALATDLCHPDRDGVVLRKDEGHVSPRRAVLDEDRPHVECGEDVAVVDYELVEISDLAFGDGVHHGLGAAPRLLGVSRVPDPGAEPRPIPE